MSIITLIRIFYRLIFQKIIKVTKKRTETMLKKVVRLKKKLTIYANDLGEDNLI